MQSHFDDIVPVLIAWGSAASGAGGKDVSRSKKNPKPSGLVTADAIKTALSTLQTMHETEMVRAEMAGDNVEILRLKYRQLSEELGRARRPLLPLPGPSWRKLPQPEFRKVRRREDLAKRIDGLNKKQADEERAQAQLEKQVHDTREAMKTQAQDAKNWPLS